MVKARKAYISSTEEDSLSSELDSLCSGSADLVDGGADDGVGEAGAEGGLAGGVLAWRAWFVRLFRSAIQQMREKRGAYRGWQK